jgi:hypothetical protein
MPTGESVFSRARTAAAIQAHPRRSCSSTRPESFVEATSPAKVPLRSPVPGQEVPAGGLQPTVRPISTGGLEKTQQATRYS